MSITMTTAVGIWGVVTVILLRTGLPLLLTAVFEDDFKLLGDELPRTTGRKTVLAFIVGLVLLTPVGFLLVRIGTPAPATVSPALAPPLNSAGGAGQGSSTAGSVFALCSETTAQAPPGWQAVYGAQITAGADPGSVCITSTGHFSGLDLPHTYRSDYSVSVRGRLTSASGTLGWGLAARAMLANGTVYGHAIQYDPGAGGYQDTDYPSTQAVTYPASTDHNWHTLKVIVRGSQYTLKADGTTIAQGQLSETGDGAYIRVSNGGTVELNTPTVTPL